MLWRQPRGKRQRWKGARWEYQGSKNGYVSQQAWLEKEPATGYLGAEHSRQRCQQVQRPRGKNLKCLRNSKEASVTRDKSSTYNKCVLILQENTEVKHLKNERARIWTHRRLNYKDVRRMFNAMLVTVQWKSLGKKRQRKRPKSDSKALTRIISTLEKGRQWLKTNDTKGKWRCHSKPTQMGPLWQLCGVLAPYPQFKRMLEKQLN